MIIPESEFVINPDGSVYHLGLKPGEASDKAILVGDPGRVDFFAQFLDSIEIQRKNREFNTVTGHYNGKRVSIASTGIGPDNIDIFLQEYYGLFHGDFKTRMPAPELRKLRFVRIGTTGAVQPDIEIDSPVVSQFALGLDNLMNYYNFPEEFDNSEIGKTISEHLGFSPSMHQPKVIAAPGSLINQFSDYGTHGITATAPGFFGPQGRSVRIQPAYPGIEQRLTSFKTQKSGKNLRVCNFEMETSALYGLSHLLGHEALTICTVVANRLTRKFSKNHEPGLKEILFKVLEVI